MQLFKNQVRRNLNDSLLAWKNLSRIESAMQAKLAEQYKRFNLTQPQYEVLALLWVNPEGLTQKEITEKLQWSKGNTTGVLVRMVEKDFLSRETVLEDKRFHKVILTHKGRNLSDKIIPQIENIISDLFVSILSVRERRMLSEILAITFDGL